MDLFMHSLHLVKTCFNHIVSSASDRLKQWGSIIFIFICDLCRLSYRFHSLGSVQTVSKQSSACCSSGNQRATGLQLVLYKSVYASKKKKSVYLMQSHSNQPPHLNGINTRLTCYLLRTREFSLVTGHVICCVPLHYVHVQCIIFVNSRQCLVQSSCSQ